MSDPDTELRAGSPAFPTTHWSIVCAAREPQSDAGRTSLQKLMEAYWRPVYVYIRTAWSRPNEDAKDLTQEFLARMIDGSVLHRADPSKGRFRGYLKGALRNFLMDVEKTASRQKRGGGATVLSFDASALPEPEAGATPDELFDREWAATLVREATAELARRLTADGRDVCWRVFEHYESPPAGSSELSYGEVGARLGIPAGEVKAHLTYARLVLRKILRERVADTVASEEELHREIGELFGT